MVNIGTNIIRERLGRGITQKRLAELTGISQANLSAIERGKRDLTVSTLQRIGRALDVGAGRLLGEDEGPEAVVLTRSRIERIARLVVGGGDLAGRPDGRTASLFRDVLPAPGARRKPAKRTLRSWLELRRSFDQSQITSVLGRIRDAEQRAV